MGFFSQIEQCNGQRRILIYHVKHHITILPYSEHLDIFAGAVRMARIQNGGRNKGRGGHSYETLLE